MTADIEPIPEMPKKSEFASEYIRLMDNVQSAAEEIVTREPIYV